MRRSFFLAAVPFVAAAALVFASPAGAAQGSTYISSGPGVYNRTPAEYANHWGWFISSGYVGNSQDHYFWYLFKTDGSIYVNGQIWDAGAHTISPPGNVYYWKEYNHTADHSAGGRAMTWWVCWNVGSTC
jgi:hypothetical protein